MRLIDADALETYWECFDDPDLDYQYVLKADIDAAPTIDPVKHGRWVDATKEIGWPVWKCSVCGGDGRGDYFVCPWCGAKMDEVKDD